MPVLYIIYWIFITILNERHKMYVYSILFKTISLKISSGFLNTRLNSNTIKCNIYTAYFSLLSKYMHGKVLHF